MKNAMLGAALGAAAGVIVVSFMVRRAFSAPEQDSPKTYLM